MKKKAFVVLPGGAESLGQLNQALDQGWSVVVVHPSGGSQMASWLVIAAEPDPDAGRAAPATPASR